MGRGWVRPLARIGFVARGIVYITVGVLAGRAALGDGGRTTDLQGGIREIGRTESLLLPFLALGLASYAAWRLAQAFFDTERKGRDWKGLARRSAYLGSAGVHLGLALTAARLAIGAGDGQQGVQGWTARALAEDWGRLAVAAAGVGVAVAGVYQLYSAWTARFARHLDLDRLDDRHRAWVMHAGRAGYAARGVTFALIGVFLVQAARAANAAQAGGLGDALRTLQRQDHGPWYLGAAALGLVGYGVLALYSARYRRIAT
jgi:hypothetical protein